MDLVPSAIYYKNRENICQACNKGFEKLTGLTKNEIIGRNIAELNFDKEAINPALDDILFLIPDQQNFEIQLRHLNGTLHNLNVHRNIYYDKEGQPAGIVGVVNDISDNKQLEMVIQKSLAILNSILESSNDGLLALQIEGENKTILASNPRLRTLFDLSDGATSDNYEQAEMLSKTKNPKLVQAKLDYLYEHPDVSSYDIIELTNNNVLERFSTPFRLREEQIGRVFSYRDITEKQKAEEKLQESIRRHEALWDQSSDGIFVYHAETLQIFEANASFLQMIGYSLEELKAKNLLDFIEVGKADLLLSIKETLEFGQRYVGFRKYRCHNNTLLDLEVKCSAITYQQQSLILVNARDITDRTRLEDSIMAEVQLAAKVQRQFLPKAIENNIVTVKNIFLPWQIVSGDIFDYKWNHDQTKLTGFILDVSGHGISTALKTSMFLAMAKDVMQLAIPLEQKMSHLNKQIVPWSEDGTSVAAIMFEFDFKSMTLTYVPAGIGYLLLASHYHMGIIKTPGFVLGFFENVEFEEHIIPLKQGDSIYFVSDGISDLLPQPQTFFHDRNFYKNINFLKKLITSPERRDDASAVCVHIGTIRKHILEIPIANPQNYDYQLKNFKPTTTVFKNDPRMLAAIKEAFDNGIKHGNKSDITKRMQIKLSLVLGRRLIIRVKDEGKGFAGNEMIKQLNNKLHGKIDNGLSRMLLAFDRVIYNEKGNEVLMVKRVVSEEGA